MDSNAHSAVRTRAPTDNAETPLELSGNTGKRTSFRWVVCALLFFATTINYMDRQIIGVLKPAIESEMHWSESDYANIVFAFSLAYAIGQFLSGRFMDAVGVRTGYLVAVIAWSLAAMGHGFAYSLAGFVIARLALGISEGGNFPGAIKTVSNWFPPKERAFATGLFNSGSNMGALATPLCVPWIAITYGWRAAFLLTGALGILWVVAWLIFYREPEVHPRVNRAELEHFA